MPKIFKRNNLYEYIIPGKHQETCQNRHMSADLPLSLYPVQQVCIWLNYVNSK